MQRKNAELAFKLEAALKEQSNSNGNDKALAEHLNHLKSDLEEYKSSSHSKGDWLSQLYEEADRLKTKLTNTAIDRVNFLCTCVVNLDFRVFAVLLLASLEITFDSSIYAIPIVHKQPIRDVKWTLDARELRV